LKLLFHHLYDLDFLSLSIYKFYDKIRNDADTKIRENSLVGGAAAAV